MADKWDTRTIVTNLEFTADESAALQARAAQAGLTVEEYLRTLFGSPP